LYFRKDIPSHYRSETLKKPIEAIKDFRLFKLSWFILGILLTAYFISGYVKIPVSVFAVFASLVFLLASVNSKAVHIRGILKHAPWSVVVFSIGMYVVVYGLQNVGLTTILGKFLQLVADKGLFVSTISMGFIAAILSSVMNNMPTVMIDALAIKSVTATETVEKGLIYANVIGSDLGPKITPIGSLATLLWLHVLSQKGIRITWGYYFKIGILLTVPTLFITLIGLYVWLLLIS
jgi:arsenical pump membrane protein